MKPCIAVDMDDVIADTLHKRISEYNDHFNANLSRQDVDGKNFYQALPEQHRAWARERLADPEFFADLAIMPDSQEVLETLSQDFDIVIATAAMEVPASFNAKFAWLLEHFPFLDPQLFVFCGRKHVVKADFLIDDTPRQLEYFSGTGLLFTQPKNIHENRFARVDSWQAVRDYFV